MKKLAPHQSQAAALAPAPDWWRSGPPPQIWLTGTQASPVAARELITPRWGAEEGKARRG